MRSSTDAQRADSVERLTRVSAFGAISGDGDGVRAVAPCTSTRGTEDGPASGGGSAASGGTGDGTDAGPSPGDGA